MIPQLAFRGDSIMFWGGISLEARTDLPVTRGKSLTSQTYIQEILEPHIVPFVDDNAKPHSGFYSQCAQQFLLS